MAVNTWKAKDDIRTTWFKLVHFWDESKLGQLRKGNRIIVIGELQFDSTTGGPPTWQTDTGETRANFDVRVGRIIPLVKVEEQSLSTEDNTYDPEDIPF